MASTSTLLLMMYCMTQMSSGTLDAFRLAGAHLDADTEARMVLDRMAFDISKAVKRTDVDYYLQKNTGNDQMAFYSETSGYQPAGSTSSQVGTTALVGYRINSSNQLERLSKGLVWNGVAASGNSPMVFLPQTLTGTWPDITTSSSSAGTDPDYQVISDQVFRFEYCYLVQNSSNNAQLASTPYLAPETSVNGLSDVVAVVVSIAVLDDKSRASITGPRLQNAATLLPDVTGDNVTARQLPSRTWESAIESTNLGLPKTAQQQVRVYQRYCYLNPVP